MMVPKKMDAKQVTRANEKLAQMQTAAAKQQNTRIAAAANNQPIAAPAIEDDDYVMADSDGVSDSVYRTAAGHAQTPEAAAAYIAQHNKSAAAAAAAATASNKPVTAENANVSATANPNTNLIPNPIMAEGKSSGEAIKIKFGGEIRYCNTSHRQTTFSSPILFSLTAFIACRMK